MTKKINESEEEWLFENEDLADEEPARRVGDWVKRAVQTGVGAVFLTEESLRNAVSELKLPKNVIASVVSQAEKTKAEAIKSVAREFRLFLDGLRVDEILKKVLKDTTIEIRAQIRVVPKKKHKKKPAEPKE